MPEKRRDIIRKLRALGFDGPVRGSDHEYMRKGGLRIKLPNPHQRDPSDALVAEVVRKAGITKKQWDQL